MKTVKRAITLMLFVLLTLGSVGGSQPDEKVDFDALATRTAAAVRESTNGSSQSATVLILDFREKSAPASELGRELATEFDAALRKHSQGFVVLDAADLKEAVKIHNLPENTLSSPANTCYAADLGATVSIEGRLEVGSANVELELLARQVGPRKLIFRDSITFPLSASMTRLAGTPAPSAPPVFTDEKKEWINPEKAPNITAPKQPRNPGLPNRLPECEYCPQPAFSNDAISAKFMGTLTLQVQIRADGIPAKISTSQGLPCGLTDNAIEAVEHWRFKPATGPNGEPVAVEQTVQVTFRLY
jgi:TonB family protein